ncbi:MAG: T9SS type A sorting domain-containing protein, partial [Fimbriimonadaceae bacterium]|nr:T9SS type A sorting domain-containing protein [Chitinophagales bacterium]
IDNGGGCVRTSNTINAESTPLPIAIIDADGPTEFCDGGDVTLSVDVVVDSYLWSNGATTPTITVSETGNYSVQLFKNSCTAISDPVAITVNENPSVTISASGLTTFCDGGSVILTAHGADSYVWSNGETTQSITVDASGSFSVVGTTDAGCVGVSLAMSVTENANPTAGISADGPTTFCTGGSVNLTATGGTSYLWSNGATTATINVTAGGDYSVTAFNAASCSDESSTISVTVEVCGSVSISADGATEFCEGGSVMLTSSEASGNEWNTGETTQSITVSESGDYYVVNGENTSNTISVTVNASPDASISADGDTEFCEGGSVNINAVAGYDTYLWSDGSTGSSTTASESGNYSVMITDNGCISESSSIEVTENSNPEPTISADGSTSFCEGSVNLNVDGTYASYLWSTGSTDASINVTEAGSYSAMVTDANGCSGSSNTIEVTSGTAPTVSAAVVGSNRICYNGSVELSATASGGSLQWYRFGTPVAGETGSTLITSVPGMYTCVATDGECSTTSNSVAIKSAKVLNISPEGTLTVCPGSSITLEISVLEYPATFQWYKGPVAVIGATSNTYTVTDPGKYYCIVSRAGCDRITEKVNVINSCRTDEVSSTHSMEVYPNPSIDNFTVEYNSYSDGNVMMRITDITGKIHLEENVYMFTGANTIDYSTNQLPSGVYLLSITNMKNERTQIKLVIEK